MSKVPPPMRRARRTGRRRALTPARPILLRDGDLTVGVDAECGGSLTRFEVRSGSRAIEILRPSREPQAGRPCALGASGFPLVPYAGRLREGRFRFDGREYRWPLNALPERHASHGDGWTRRWQLLAADDASATMELERDAASALQYRCSQTVSLTGSRLQLTLTVQNLAAQRMPFGVGQHPYFANRPLATITARLPLRWRWDSEMMPVAVEPNDLEASLARGELASRLPIASEYAGWDGAAAIEWPSLGVRVELRTEPALRHVVMWMPEGESFFCFEPISHATDALNPNAGHAAADDFVVLEPAASFTQRFDFRVAVG